MQPEVAHHYAKLNGKMSEADFLARIAKARDDFNGLLDDEALALLVLDDLGFNEGAFVTIEELPGRAEATVRASIDRIDPPRTFQREGKPEGRVCNLLVSDATGAARVVLWDRDVEKTEDGTLKIGNRVTLVNVRVKESKWGLELHVGPWSVLDVEGAMDPAKKKLLDDVRADAAPTQEIQPTSLRGRIALVLPTRPYAREGGGTGFACDIDLDTAAGRKRVVVWDDLVRDVRKLGEGALVSLDPLVPKARGAATEWHTSKETKLSPG